MKTIRNSVILLFLIGFSLQAQQSDEGIKKDIQTYFSLLQEEKISEALDWVHPELLGMIGKEMFEAQYKEIFESPGVKGSLSDLGITNISEKFEHAEEVYVLVDYNFKLTMVVDMSDDDNGMLAPLLKGTYERQYGVENVVFEEPGTFHLRNNRQMFAISSPTFEGWKILDYEKGMKMILATIIPEEVFAHFNK